ncbi:MAG: hypothetical protein EU532_14145 [Promethearchaeota archaeon]|nr:MAG: hypothetical protein EU532_14145 [Candidatus Lokiarchaeota archaeon]
MRENTKYSDYRFVGKINVDENQPWFDFASNKPWDEGEIPWVVENKVRREILIKLADGPKTFDEIYQNINFSPKPLLILKEEYDTKVSYQWTRETVENHLLNLEWYNLIKLTDGKYELTFPILKMDKEIEIGKYITRYAENWIKIIREMKDEVHSKFENIREKAPFYEILVEKAVEKLYEFLKKEKLLPNEPNIKALWAEQLRKIKFEEWIEKNF